MFSDELKRKQEILEDGSEDSNPSLRDTANGAISHPPNQKEILCTHYQVVEQLGSGGMGDVLLCRHVTLGQLVAIKVLRVDKATSAISLSRFEKEAKATFQLNHPNIIRMLDFRISEDGRPCLIMEYLASKGLDQILAREGTLDVDRVVSMFAQICDGLIYAHSKGIIHRDLKPSNLMVGKRDDGSEEVKIVDFGIAKIVEIDQNNQLTQTGEIFGSPLYMSPEQCTGASPDQRSDLYSLGCAMFEALTGEPPFRGANQMQTMFMHVQQSPPIPKFGKPTIPADTLAMGSILNKLLSKDPNKRFQNASELKNALLALKAAGTKARQQTINPLFVRVAVATVLCAIGIWFCIYNYTKPTANPKAPNKNITDSAASSKRAKEAAENKYLESLDERSRSAKRAQSHYIKAVKLQQQNQMDQAGDEIRKAADEAKSLNKHDPLVRLILISYAAILFPQRINHPNTDLIPNLVRVEEMLNESPVVPPLHQSNLYGWHAVAEGEAHNYKQSLSLFEKAEDLANQIPNNAGHRQKIEWQMWQGLLLTQQHNIKAAKRAYDRVEREIGNTDPTALCWLFTVKAAMYETIKNKEEAKKCAEAARKIAISSNLDRSTAKLKVLDQQLVKLGMAQLH